MSAPEFDGQPMTKREVLIAREAFRRGRRDYCLAPHEVYPLPKVKRPRVAVAGEFEYRVLDGCLQTRRRDGTSAWGESIYSADWMRTLMDLISNPTEEVDA